VSARALALCLPALAVIAIASPARADKQRALQYYGDGKAKYQSGDYKAAIALFEKAYTEHPSPAYLFNIAQAHRQLGDCPNALRHYRRFVAERPDARDAAEPHIQALAAECEVARDRPLGDTDSAAGGAGPGNDTIDPDTDRPTRAGRTGSSSAGGDIERGVETGRAPERGPIVSLVAEAGAALFDVGDVVTPVAAAVRVGAAYPLRVGPVHVEPGVTARIAPMAYRDATGESTAMWTTLLANVAASLPVGRLRVGGELGVGALVLSGLTAGNPFADEMEPTERSTSVAVRVGAAAECALAQGLAVSASPAFGYAAAPSELRDEISAVMTVELLGGLRYRW
jgi:hypothetical protein